jgi:hypothetical protein
MVIKYMFILLIKYSKIGCVYVVLWICVVYSHPVIKNKVLVCYVIV